MEKQADASPQPTIVAERERMEKALPQLAQGYQAFQQSFAAYERMASQFQAHEDVKVDAASRVFRLA